MEGVGLRALQEDQGPRSGVDLEIWNIFEGESHMWENRRRKIEGYRQQ